MTIDEYYKDMELLTINTRTIDDPEATMFQFFDGMNVEVDDRF
jgi:hypothetical protein